MPNFGVLKNPTSMKEIFRRQHATAISRHVSPTSLLDDSSGKRLPQSSGGRIRNDPEMSPRKGLDSKTNGLTVKSYRNFNF
jgi:hypothetical protein